MERATQIAVNKYGVNIFLEDEIQVVITRTDILERKMISTYWLRQIALQREEVEAAGGEYVEPEVMVVRGRIIGFEPDVPAHDGEERFVVIKQELDSKETEFLHIEFEYFLQLIDRANSPIELLTGPLFQYGVSYTNRHTNKTSRFISVTPGRDTQNGQFHYLIETIKADGSIEYELMKESCLLKNFNSTEFIQTLL